jgi:hypothetical protein
MKNTTLTKYWKKGKGGALVLVNNRLKTQAQVSHDQIREGLQGLIYTEDENAFHLVQEVFDDAFVYAVEKAGERPTMYKQAYTVDGKGRVSLEGDPTEVVAQTEYSEVKGNTQRRFVTNDEPSEAQIREQIKRFLKACDTKDLRGNPMLSHELVEIRQRYFVYKRTDHNGNTVTFKRSFALTDQGDVRIVDDMTKVTDRELADLTANDFGAPPMPKPKWNNGRPDYSHLETRQEEPKSEGVPAMPRPVWKNGKPCFKHLNS